MTDRDHIARERVAEPAAHSVNTLPALVFLLVLFLLLVVITPSASAVAAVVGL